MPRTHRIVIFQHEKPFGNIPIVPVDYSKKLLETIIVFVQIVVLILECILIKD